MYRHFESAGDQWLVADLTVNVRFAADSLARLRMQDSAKTCYYKGDLERVVYPLEVDIRMQQGERDYTDYAYLFEGDPMALAALRGIIVRGTSEYSCSDENILDSVEAIAGFMQIGWGGFYQLDSNPGAEAIYRCTQTLVEECMQDYSEFGRRALAHIADLERVKLDPLSVRDHKVTTIG